MSQPRRPVKASAQRAHPRPPTPLSPPAATDVPLGHPSWILAILVAAAAIVVSVSYEIYEKDFWQHLLVGKAIWQLGRVPTTQLWTWPTYGAPDVNTSWGFRALIWPVWSSAGVWGLFAWRWVTTLAAFGICWATARRMGARGLTPLAVLVLCALTYRQRSQIRPETLVAVLMALEIWILETRRSGGPDRSWWLVPLAWIWINVHISYHLGFALLVAYLLDDLLVKRPRSSDAPRPPRARLAWPGLAALAVSFVNPFGARALWQPFDFFLHQRHEPIMQGIYELLPLDLSHNLTNLLPLVLFGWPVLMVWRWRRSGFDLAEVLCWAGFCGLSFLSQRFLGFAMIVAAPFVGRDLDAWVRARRWPAWTSPPWTRSALASVAMVGLGFAEWSRVDLPLRVSIRYQEYPVGACDFMAAHGVRGRGFNQFFYGGYQLYRFWPERDRLPFMDIHQAGTTRDRYDYSFSAVTAEAWHVLDQRHHFDYVLLRRPPYPGDQRLEMMDADTTTWSLVFMDDAAALYVRRDGPLRPLAERFGYRLMGAGAARAVALSAAVRRDSSMRARVAVELEREAHESKFNSLALTRLGSTAIVEADLARARSDLDRALAANPRAPRAHEWLGVVAMQEGRPRDALRLFEEEHRLNQWVSGYDLRRGQAWQRIGDLSKARASYDRELKRDPGNQEARDSLESLARLGGASGR